jgi:uroporphyrinogen decarboxylase
MNDTHNQQIKAAVKTGDSGEKGFRGLRVVSFESRRAEEIASLISHHGGIPIRAPSMREIPLEENREAFLFAERLFGGGIDVVIFMTGVGTRTLVQSLETCFPSAEFVAALSKVTVVARGPKPVKALRDLSVPITMTIPEPNTWREILQALDESEEGIPLRNRRVAVQEYGLPNQDFLRELEKRGAHVMRVPVYRWALPEDTTPLRDAIRLTVKGEIQVALFTNAMQINHVLEVASEEGMADDLLHAFKDMVIASIGPISSESLTEHGLQVDMEPRHPRMGHLVEETAKKAMDLLKMKRQGGAVESVRVVPPHEHEIFDPNQSAFMKACRCEATAFTPIWLMRQAGRYMPEYRQIRAKLPFIELCKNPALAAEITVKAAERIGADAAIIFTDILLILQPMGLGLEFSEGEGPIVRNMVRESRDVDRLSEVEPEGSLGFVFDAIRMARSALNPRTPLIGFAGAPFTLASYMIEGGASKNYQHTKSLMYRDPSAWHAMMSRITRALVSYLNGQIKAGVQAVQIFDSWVGCLGPEDYTEFVLPHAKAVIEALPHNVPVIHFATGNPMLLESLRAAGGHVIGLDFRVSLDRAWACLGNVAVQGNLDPLVLLAEPSYIRYRTKMILEQAAGRPGHIFNLGHGILPSTPPENVIALVDAVHELSVRSQH